MGLGFSGIVSSTNSQATPWNVASYYTKQNGINNVYTNAGANNSAFNPDGSLKINQRNMPSTSGTANNNGFANNILDLLSQQKADNAWSRQQNQAAWDEAKNRMLGVLNNYNNDPIAQATRARVQSLLADPEALNDRTQQMIQNRASNQINAQQAGQMRDMAGLLAASGQADAGSMAAALERSNRAAMAQRANTATTLDIQRAQQRNADILNAINAGQSNTGQNFGLQTNIAESLLNGRPQYRADDMSGLIAALGQFNGGSGAQTQSYQQAAPQGLDPQSLYSGVLSGGGLKRTGINSNPMWQNWTPAQPDYYTGNADFGGVNTAYKSQGKPVVGIPDRSTSSYAGVAPGIAPTNSTYDTFSGPVKPIVGQSPFGPSKIPNKINPTAETQLAGKNGFDGWMNWL